MRPADFNLGYIFSFLQGDIYDYHGFKGIEPKANRDGMVDKNSSVHLSASPPRGMVMEMGCKKMQVKFGWSAGDWSRKLFILFLVLFFSSHYGCLAQTEKERLSNLRSPLRQYFPRDWQWTKADLTGDDSPFCKIRQTIDASVAKSQKLDVLAEHYREVAVSKPTDPLAQFAWVYTDIMLRKPGYHFGNRYLSDVSAALASATSPNTYEYARMRYIVLMTWGTWLQLKPLGKRLLQHYPQDYKVKLPIVRLLAIQGTMAEQQQALIYAKELTQSQPKRISAWGALATAYQEICFDRKDVSAGNKAIAALKKSIDLMPPNDPGRANSANMVRLIQKRQAYWH